MYQPAPPPHRRLPPLTTTSKLIPIFFSSIWCNPRAIKTSFTSRIHAIRASNCHHLCSFMKNYTNQVVRVVFKMVCLVVKMERKLCLLVTAFHNTFVQGAKGVWAKYQTDGQVLQGREMTVVFAEDIVIVSGYLTVTMLRYFGMFEDD